MIDPGKLFTDPTEVEAGYEPFLHSIHYPSGGVNIFGYLMTAGGSGRHPLVLMLHGFPGTEKNYDVAQGLRAVGFHVAHFHYRGSWGSPGSFSFVNVLQDPMNVLDYLKKPEIAEQYGIDTERLFVIGHSMGGFAALHTMAARLDLLGCCGIAPYDFGSAHLAAKADPARAEGYRNVMGQPIPELKTATPTALFDDLEVHAAEWSFPTLAPRLAGKRVLMLGFDRDTASTPAMLAPAVEAFRKAGVLQDSQTYDTDHSYNSKRVAVTKSIVNFFAPLANA